VARLLTDITALPLEQTRAALETSALIAAVSLRASMEFLRAVLDAAQVLEPAELRAWGELGRRLTMTDVETGVSFFVSGTADFEKVPSVARPFVFQVCARQMILSANTAAETFRDAPSLAEAVGEGELLRSIYEVAASISRRSAKHSAEFLHATPQVIAALRREGVGGGGLGVDDPNELSPSQHRVLNVDVPERRSHGQHPAPHTLHPELIAGVDAAETPPPQQLTTSDAPPAKDEDSDTEKKRSISLHPTPYPLNPELPAGVGAAETSNATINHARWPARESR
jgi:hypothetical protein